MFRKIGAAVLFVRDLEGCAKFYRDTLGLEVAFTDSNSFAFKMEDQDFALVKISAGVDMISEEAISPHKDVGHRVLLCVDLVDVDSTYKSLTARGLAFIKPPINQPWGLRTAYFADPEGNLWEIRQPVTSEEHSKI